MVMSGAVALALVSSAPAAAQEGSLQLGGGALPGPVSADVAVSRAIAVGIAVPPARNAVRVRLGAVLDCGRGRTRGDDLLLRLPLRGDAFARTVRLRSDELGRVRVRLAGMLGAHDARGTVRVRSARRGRRCDSGTRPWVAAAPPAPDRAPPAPVAGSTLAGITDEPGSIPHGVVALVGDGGTALRMATSFGESCANRVAGRTRSARLDIQFVWRALPIVDGAFRADEADRETPAERRRRITYRFAGTMSGTFAGPAITGSFAYTDVYREPGFESSCRRTPVRFHAGPVPPAA